ncbi:MAG TPA: hypothetical protein PLM00_04945 [Spirochaetota bacterium]|nr:hypothetical protein [Spirochaetota bacterium]HPN82715.1 hypothetical protein [Spirochaetota bacterium]
MSFIKRFVVIMIALLSVAGFFLIGKISNGAINQGQFLLYVLVPMIVGIVLAYSILDTKKSAGLLAFGVVAGGLFVWLAVIDPVFTGENTLNWVWALTGIGAAAGVLLYLFQIKD